MKEGWKEKPLGHLCDILDSRRVPITKRDRKTGKYPYYGATGILDYVDSYIFDEKLVLLGEDGAKWGSGENSAYIIDGKSWVNNHAHVLRPHRSCLLDSWLVYYLNYSDLLIYVSGLTVPKLNQGNMVEIPIPLPPLPEQQRIVAILDEAFAAIETAKANTEQNLQNARELVECYFHIIFYSDQNKWEEVQLGDVCYFDKKQGSYKNLPYVGLEHIESNTARFLGSIEPQTVKSNTFQFTSEHLLYGRLRPYLNKVLLPDFEGHCSTEIFPIISCSLLKREYLFYWFLSGSLVK